MVIKKWSKVINNSNFVYMNIKRIVILIIINIDKKNRDCEYECVLLKCNMEKILMFKYLLFYCIVFLCILNDIYVLCLLFI